MLAFHNKPRIKKQYLARVLAHEKADEIISGVYWEGGKGCAVGCTVHSSQHNAYEKELGIPEVLAYLEDRIFENLPNHLAKVWPRQFLTAIKPGADLSKVWPKFASWLLTDETEGVIRFAREVDKEIIQSISDLYLLVSIGADVSVEDFQEAYSASSAFAASAASAASAAYSAFAAFAASAASAASAADYAASAASAASAAREKCYMVQSIKLLELLREAK